VLFKLRITDECGSIALQENSSLTFEVNILDNLKNSLSLRALKILFVATYWYLIVVDSMSAIKSTPFLWTLFFPASKVKWYMNPRERFSESILRWLEERS
jgi:hypothetical protein